MAKVKIMLRYSIQILVLLIFLSSTVNGQSFQGKIISIENKLALQEVVITGQPGQENRDIGLQWFF